MKAVYFEKPGGLSVLRYGNFPNPKLNRDEALIRVRACGLNRLDIWLRHGRWGIEMPHIPGSDVAGVIEKIKPNSQFKPGDEVVINPSIPCGSCQNCQKDLSCNQVNIFGYNTQGGYAQFTTAPIAQLYPKPKNLSFVEAAAFPLTFLTAWHMLVTRAALTNGETVFIWGATGGLGTAAIAISKYLGAKVIAAAGSKWKAAKLKKLGVDHVVIYSEENVEDSVKKLTRGLGVDVVFESVGQKTWQISLAILRPLGRVVIAGTTSGDVGTLGLSELYYHQFTILGARMGSKEEFEKVLKLVESGKLKPVIDKVSSLSDAAKAQERMEKSQHVGKIVLEI